MLLLEAYHTGSHQLWADGYRRHSAHDVKVLSMAGRFWKWRMHGAAVTLARRMGDMEPTDADLASDMLDLAALRGLLSGAWARVPIVAYFHENQVAYPPPKVQAEWSVSRRRRARRRDLHYAWINFTTALAADAVWWNSRYNLESFLRGTRRLLRSMPDHRELDSPETVEAKSRVVPVGLDLDGAEPSATGSTVSSRGPDDPPRLLWNHRWEHDKAPDAFVAAVDRLAEAGVAFELVVLGESFGSAPPAFERLRARHADRILQWGHVEDRRTYWDWLRASDVVVSTAAHEFFGVAVWEAVAAGCVPVLPDRLAYPEMVPEQWHDPVLYADAEGLFRRLQAALAASDDRLRAGLVARAQALDWRQVAPDYDAGLERLAMLSFSHHAPSDKTRT